MYGEEEGGLSPSDNFPDQVTIWMNQLDEPVSCKKVKTGLKSRQLLHKIPGSSDCSSKLSPGLENYRLESALLP